VFTVVKHVLLNSFAASISFTQVVVGHLFINQAMKLPWS